MLLTYISQHILQYSIEIELFLFLFRFAIQKYPVIISVQTDNNSFSNYPGLN